MRDILKKEGKRKQKHLFTQLYPSIYAETYISGGHMPNTVPGAGPGMS